MGSAIGRQELHCFDDALRDYSRAVALDPRNTAAHLSRGALYAKQGDTEKANADFSATVRQTPILAAALVRRGPGYALNGEWDNVAGALFQERQLFLAIAQWRAAIRIHPNAPGMMGMAAWVMAAGPLPVRNEKEALDLADRAVVLTGGRNPALLAALAAAYRASHRPAMALEMAEKAIALATAEHSVDLAEAITVQTVRRGIWSDRDIVNNPQ